MNQASVEALKAQFPETVEHFAVRVRSKDESTLGPWLLFDSASYDVLIVHDLRSTTNSRKVCYWPLEEVELKPWHELTTRERLKMMLNYEELMAARKEAESELANHHKNAVVQLHASRTKAEVAIMTLLSIAKSYHDADLIGEKRLAQYEAQAAEFRAMLDYGKVTKDRPSL